MTLVQVRFYRLYLFRNYLVFDNLTLSCFSSSLRTMSLLSFYDDDFKKVIHKITFFFEISIESNFVYCFSSRSFLDFFNHKASGEKGCSHFSKVESWYDFSCGMTWYRLIIGFFCSSVPNKLNYHSLTTAICYKALFALYIAMHK